MAGSRCRPCSSSLRTVARSTATRAETSPTGPDDIWDAVEHLGLDPIDPEPWVPEAEVPTDLGRFFKPANLDLYFRGNMFAALAIKMRTDDPASKDIAEEHRLMSKATIDAWEAWSVNVP